MSQPNDDGANLIERAFAETDDAQRHQWVIVIVAPLTDREAEGYTRGERKTFRKLDLRDPEVVRSTHVMCAVCKFAPKTLVELTLPCEGGPI